MVRARAPWIYPAFYVWAEIVSNLFIVQFWTLANDLHDARAAKRLFGTIGSARLLASVAVGLATGAIVRAIGMDQLIFVLAALMLGFGALAIPVARQPRAERSARAGAQPRRLGPPPKVLADPYVRALALILLLAFTALNIGDYQFKAIARATYSGGQARAVLQPLLRRRPARWRSSSRSSPRRGSSPGSAWAGGWRRCRRCSGRRAPRCSRSRSSRSRR